MYARSTTTLGILSAMALAVPAHRAPSFTLDAAGAVNLSAAGREARYGTIAPDPLGPPLLSISIGPAAAGSVLQLTVPGGWVPETGRYPIQSTWNDPAIAPAFHASFSAGSPEHPLGWFHGEYGTVTITRAAGGRLIGRFEVRARGFLSADPADEDRWVTVTGSFDAERDTATTAIAAAR